MIEGSGEDDVPTACLATMITQLDPPLAVYRAASCTIDAGLAPTLHTAPRKWRSTSIDAAMLPGVMGCGTEGVQDGEGYSVQQGWEPQEPAERVGGGRR